MNRKVILSLLITLHLALLLPAPVYISANNWSVNFYSYNYSNGWGHPFHSDYSLPRVLLYLAAYGSGIIATAMLWKRFPNVMVGLAMLICAIGTASFALELTHWLWSHHLTVIGSFPSLLLMLWIGIGVKLARLRSRNRQPIPQPELAGSED